MSQQQPLMKAEVAMSLYQRKLAGEKTSDLAKEVGVPAQYLFNKFSSIKYRDRNKAPKAKVKPVVKAKAKRAPKKVKAHVFTDLPLHTAMAPTPQLASSSKRYAVVLIPQTDLKSFLSEVFDANS